MKLYLAGPMRGIEAFNFPAFNAGAEDLRVFGHEVFNPAERDSETGFDPTGMTGNEDLAAQGFSLREALAADTAYIASHADAVVLLADWERSSGVAAEIALARALGLPVVPLTAFLFAEPDSVEAMHLLDYMSGMDIPAPSGTVTIENNQWVGKGGIHLASAQDAPTDEVHETRMVNVSPDANVSTVVPAGGDHIEGGYTGRVGSSEWAEPLGGSYIPNTDARRERNEAIWAEVSAKLTEDNYNKITTYLDDGPALPSGEVRTTSATGGQKGVKPQRFDLLPTLPLNKVAEVYAFGAKKYASHNWRKGYEWSSSYAAAMRHMTAFWGGEDIDPETGTPHPANAVFHMFTLLQFMVDFPQYDDRYKGV